MENKAFMLKYSVNTLLCPLLSVLVQLPEVRPSVWLLPKTSLKRFCPLLSYCNVFLTRFSNQSQQVFLNLSQNNETN